MCLKCAGGASTQHPYAFTVNAVIHKGKKIVQPMSWEKANNGLN